LASLPKWQLKKPSLQNKSQWVNSILGHNPVHLNEINFLDLSEFANFPWVTHFGPHLPQNQSLKQHYASFRSNLFYSHNDITLAQCFGASG
jgi:hypothetical protein